MLDVLNRYAHGFVVVPVVLACRKGGVFEALEARPRSAEELAEELGANLGHLQVALRLFESLGWIDRRTDGRFEANASLAKQRTDPGQTLGVDSSRHGCLSCARAPVDSSPRGLSRPERDGTSTTSCLPISLTACWSFRCWRS